MNSVNTPAPYAAFHSGVIAPNSWSRIERPRQNGMIWFSYSARASALTANGILSREFRRSRSWRVWQQSSG